MFNLSGAVNVLLFLIIRPRLLLFSSPESLKVAEPEAQMSHLNTGSILLDTVQFKQSPETAEMSLGDHSEERPQNFTSEGSRNHETPSHIASTQIVDDI
jgi:hypothetical protein